MSIEMMSLFLLGGLLLLLVLGVEIAIAMGVVASLGLLLIINQSQDQIAWSAFRALNSFVMTAVPLFIFMGAMFANTGVVRSLFDGADKLIGGLPGGLAVATTGACALFGAMSGSGIAATATFGTICFPEMERKGYNHRLALGSIVVGGSLAVLIPPSVIMLVYGGMENVSIVRLFAGGIIPGIILTSLIILNIVIRVKLNPSLAPRTETKFTLREKLVAIRGLLPWVGIIVLVLGVIFGGIMTPTEAAALGAFLGIVVSLAYRRLTWLALKKSVVTTVKVTAMVGFLMAAATVLSFVFQSGGITEAATELLAPFNKWMALMIIYLIYLILGMFIDNISMLLLTLPFVMPIIDIFGFSRVWFGVVYVVMVEISTVTPPFGLNLFALKGVVPKYSIMEIAYSALAFYPSLFITLALVTVFPELVLWLPTMMAQ